jgi:hypothetical protein
MATLLPSNLELHIGAKGYSTAIRKYFGEIKTKSMTAVPEFPLRFQFDSNS